MSIFIELKPGQTFHYLENHKYYYIGRCSCCCKFTSYKEKRCIHCGASLYLDQELEKLHERKPTRTRIRSK